MANHPHNPQDQGQQRPRKNVAPQPAKQAPGRSGKTDADRPNPQPQNPADLGHDPKPDDIQSRLGQSSEKSSR
jgi:hypothetical protein